MNYRFSGSIRPPAALGKILIFLVLSGFIPGLMNADNIRGPVSGKLSLAGERILDTRVEHLCALEPGEGSPLIQGIKLSLKANESMILYQNSFALYLYKNLDSPFSADNSSYRGTQILMRLIPFKNDLNILIPLDKDHTMSPDRSSVVLNNVDRDTAFPLLLTILPVSKGIPDSAYLQDIRLELTPVHYDKGLLNLTISNEQGETLDKEISLSINNKPYKWPGSPYILGTGLHNLTIRTQEGNEESLDFSLEAGEILNINHVLQFQLPLLSIKIIEGLAIFLDGRLLETEELEMPMEIDPGNHSIQFALGNFKVSRDFSAEMQQRIFITLVPEILMEYR